ncbi:SpoIIE family protein phosphatase [Kitasatospora sp. NPDC059571]|uniref:SpoIIE family protein phosphatase n=1 Tax=Kitasatospora sp. NPDC059571 TaxID=3346871 RepID=UPI003691ADBA
MAESTSRSGGEPAADPERAVLEAAVDRLRAEAEGLRAAMRTRAVIEQAKGLLAERLGCTPEEAFERLSALSQDANRKVADLAAELLGATGRTPGRPPAPARSAPGPASAPRSPDAPARSAPGPASAPRSPDAPARSAPGPAPAGPPAAGREPDGPEGPVDRTALAARRHLAAAALSAAATPDELARLLSEAALAPLGAAAVVLALLEPDGALRLTGSHGVDARRLSPWQRIPPIRTLPLTEAARLGTPVWVLDRAEFAARYPDLAGEDLVPGRTVCALPLRTGGQTIGAMKLGWPQEYHPEPAVEQHLLDLAGLCADHLRRLGRGARDTPGPAVEPWFRGVLDTLLDPVLVLGTVRDPDGTPVDLVVEHANRATVDLAGRTAADLRGRRLSELYPGMVASGAFRRILDTAATGVPYEGRSEQFTERVEGTVRSSAMTLHATRHLDGALVSWRTHDEQDRRDSQLDQAQRLARLGTWGWEAGSAGIDCSPEALRLLGLPASAGPVLAPGAALVALTATDRPAVRAAAEQLLAGRSPVTLEFRAGRGGERILRGLAEAVPGPPGEPPSAVRGVLQDVTPWRRAEQALAGTRSRLADQRRRTETGHRAVRALQGALTDAPAGPPAPGVQSAARYLAAEREGKVGGDWHDVLALPDGTVLVAVGDVSGHGLAAAAGMAGLRYALRALAYTGADPAELLARLNRMLCHERADHTATVVCGLLDPATGSLRWARAGHLPPLLAGTGGPARYLDPPEGLLLGVVPSAAYRNAEVRLDPGDLLLLYTDGLVVRRGADLADGLERLRQAAEEYRAGDVAGCLDHVLRRLSAPNALDDTCLLGLRLCPAGAAGAGPMVEGEDPLGTGGRA